MKRTFKQLVEINGIHTSLSKLDDFKHTKLAYAFKRFSDKNLNKIFDDFHAELQDVRIEFALTDEKTKAILYKEDGSFQNSKEGLRSVMKGIKELSEKWDAKEFEVVPYVTTEIPSNIIFTDEEKELLTGILI